MTSIEDRIRAALPSYEVGAQLGKGGWGVVYEGRHRQLGREVAIKQLPAGFSTDADVRARFMAEARTLAALDHPHVVPIYDYVEHDGLCLLVMEKLSGGTVRSRFANEGLEPARRAPPRSRPCSGAAERAPAPDPAPRRQAREPHLQRRGLAQGHRLRHRQGAGRERTMATAAGEVIGTPAYMAPEQVRGQACRRRPTSTNLRRCCTSCCRACYRSRSGDDMAAALFMHAFEQPRPLTEVAPVVPKSIADVVMRGLATDPTERFQSAESFGVALAEPAADAWGADWLVPVGIPVIGADTIVAAATGTGRQANSAAAAMTVMTGNPVPTPTKRMRPTERIERPRIELADVSRNDVVPIREVVKYPSPRVPVAVAVVLAVSAIAVALIGVGAPTRAEIFSPAWSPLRFIPRAGTRCGPIGRDRSRLRLPGSKRAPPPSRWTLPALRSVVMRRRSTPAARGRWPRCLLPSTCMCSPVARQRF